MTHENLHLIFWPKFANDEKDEMKFFTNNINNNQNGMKKCRFLLLLLALMVSVAASAQGILGTVTDESGEPIIGASVVEKGNPQNGTITNVDGQFTLRVNAGTPIVISYIGYVNQELAASNNMVVTLKEDSQSLQEVVVIGYGVQKKSVVTASIAKVTSDDLAGKTRLRADDALKGMAAGVNVTSASGQPGSQSMIRVRGTGTIHDTNPLYIIDGMPADQYGLESVNPYDIESIEVLKDAASGAIYGARAANGVILVTTKKGKKGKAQINYNLRCYRCNRLRYPPKREIREWWSGSPLCRSLQPD